MLDNWMGRGQKGSDGHDKVGLGTVRRPVIGLALGGGAARGLAHIGILRTLTAHGITPNVVVGTSMGAVVGGAYASGNLDGLEQWARGLQPRNILGYLDIRLNGSGLIGGAKLAAELESTMGLGLIEDLPVKFATVATEVRTGHEIWLTHGRMIDAMRASYALPGIFAPVLIGDRWLVDGALVNPVPVSAARALGAEIVIAANLSSDVFTHSTTIYSHGPSADTSLAAGPELATEPAPPKRGLGKFFSAERTMKREFFGGGGRPGIFPPVRIAGRWLVDGALVNPVPVSAARALGARLVIAVGLNSDLFGRGTVIADYGTNDTDDGMPPRDDSGFGGLFNNGFSLRHLFGGRQRPGIPTVMIEAFNVMQDRITRARLAGDPPDVSIMPKVGSVGWFDFHRAAESIDLGVEATEKALPSIEEAIAALSHSVEANGASPK